MPNAMTESSRSATSRRRSSIAGSRPTAQTRAASSPGSRYARSFCGIAREFSTGPHARGTRGSPGCARLVSSPEAWLGRRVCSLRRGVFRAHPTCPRDLSARAPRGPASDLSSFSTRHLTTRSLGPRATSARPAARGGLLLVPCSLLPTRRSLRGPASHGTQHSYGPCLHHRPVRLPRPGPCPARAPDLVSNR